MQRSHKIELRVNNSQSTHLFKAVGCARFAWNWGLAEWNRRYEAGEKTSAYEIKADFNRIKRELFPFVMEVSKWATSEPFRHLDSAFKRMFNKKAKHPRFKKKGQHDSLYIPGSVIKVVGKKVRIPILGWVKMTEKLRFCGKLNSITISNRAGKWFASFQVDLGDTKRESQSQGVVGVDLGIKSLAVLSDSTRFENIKSTNKFSKKLVRLNRSLSRKKKGSSNWKKAKAKLAKLHYKIACVRSDCTHKMTSAIASNYSVVCIEDLNSSGMVKNKRLAKAISDASFSEIRRQLEYKAETVVVIDRWFPSTKLCPQCGQINDMPLSKRVYSCDCGYGPEERDFHAAKNILLEGIRLGWPESTPVES